MTFPASRRNNVSAPAAERPGPFTDAALFVPLFAAVVLAHLTLLHLPYFWDEGGYYVPAALDFYHSGTLIPQFTNAHPPLPNVVLGSLWHLFGFHILVTRLAACAFAAAGLSAVVALGRRLLGISGGLTLGALTAVYPIWYAQSSLAHADIFAAAFTLAALCLFLTSPELIGKPPETLSSSRRLVATSVLFCLAALSKETAIVQPAALLAAQLFLALRHRRHPASLRAHLRWSVALALPIPILSMWFAFHFLKTGQIFGNPAYLHYNATDNFTLAHFAYALRIRCVHLFWQRSLWLPLVLTGACLFLSVRQVGGPTRAFGLPPRVLASIAVLVVANLLAFSLLGGALLTRYLLPVYPLLLLVCVAAWQDRTELWPVLATLTAVSFCAAIWLNPFTFFAPEDNLTYRNMIVVQQQAIQFLADHYPEATVLTAWPVSADLVRPELGYTNHRFRVVSLENFTPPELTRAAAEPGRYDTALLFTTHYTSPAFRRFLLTHPRSWKGRRYAEDIDLSPEQVARLLGGRVVWQADHYGEWAAILRFPRSYDARLYLPAPAAGSSFVGSVR